MDNTLKFVSLSVVLLGGCASTQPSIPMQNVSIPSLSQETSVSLGESMLKQATGYITDTITLGNVDGATTQINGGTYCRLIKGSDTFTNLNGATVGVKNAFGTVLSYTSNVTYSNGKVCVPGTMGFGCYSSNDISIDYKASDMCLSKNSFQQSIEYNGKNGTVLKFTYREFSDNMARAPFTTDFTIDLDEGNVMKYKGAKFEILRSSNTEITYKVISNFNS